MFKVIEALDLDLNVFIHFAAATLDNMQVFLLKWVLMARRVMELWLLQVNSHMLSYDRTH